MACSDKKNPLQRSGTNQAQRVLNGQKKGYVNIDERRIADWITFASSFSRYIRYVGADGNDKDWSAFFNNDISAILGAIAIQDADAYRLNIKERFLKLQNEDSTSIELKANFGSLFAILLTVSKALDDYIISLPEDIQLRSTIQNLIPARLKASLTRLLSYYKAGLVLNVLTEDDIAGWTVFNYPVKSAAFIIDSGLSGIWTSRDNPDWTNYFEDEIGPDYSIFGIPQPDPGDPDPVPVTNGNLYAVLNHAVNHNLFAGIFDQYLLAFARIVQDAEQQLIQTLETHDNHKPHYALFLAFLKLFRTSQDSINELTSRHLDFYYKDVLGVTPQNPQPAHAHLIIELAKQTDVYLLKQGTLFKAGKDSQGKDMEYELDRDTLFNKAKVSRLMSIYRGDAAGADSYNIPYGPHINNNGRLFAAPVINSADGLGAEIKTDNKAWHPFVNKLFEEGNLTGINMPEAIIGFAVASSELFLTEGERNVSINLTTNKVIPANLQADCYLTTEKGWLQVSGISVGQSSTTKKTDCSTIFFSLGGDAPAIVNYDPAVHGGNFACTTPLVKVLLRNSLDTDYTYDSLKNITVSEVEVLVRVGYSASDTIVEGGLKNLLVSGDAGVFDASKPFQPYGALPLKGSALIIGNEEVFKKKNVSLQARLEWANLPSYQYIDYESNVVVPEADYAPGVTLDYLTAGLWRNINTANSKLFNGTDPINPIVAFPNVTPATLNANGMLAYTDEYAPYDAKSKAGFLRIQLQGDFGHKLYNDDLTKYLIGLAKGQTSPPLVKPNEPYTPKLASITLHYKASSSSVLTATDEQSFDNRDVQFFHIYPFGETEQHVFTAGGTSVSFLPQFSHSDGKAVNEHVGEFFVGLEALNPGQSVNILFQVLEGSTNPLLNKPAAHITWSYLSGEQWRVFDIMSVSDNTAQLVQSGIISFVIPQDATVAHYIMPSGYVWLRASVNEAAEAVCKLLSVDAQAASATFRNNDNASDVYSLPLPAGTISKLKEALSVVKTVTQPYASFGSRQAETQQHFYTRVSERLRHKNRAVNIWDYEHLVLEAFPEIHRVKCLNHTKYVDNDYNEIAPGYVTVITLPNLVNRNDTDALRPYTSQSTLTKIGDFLKKKMSCHVKLNVRHPLFEEVLLDFKLKITDGLEFTYYSTLLQQEITEFLTPWAYGKTDDAQFGGKIIKSSIINFIEDRSYVDYITDVRMYHRINDVLTGGDLDTITASSARSILVSAQPSQHVIAQITATAAVAGAETCADNAAVIGKIM